MKQECTNCGKMAKLYPVAADEHCKCGRTNNENNTSVCEFVGVAYKER